MNGGGKAHQGLASSLGAMDLGAGLSVGGPTVAGIRDLASAVSSAGAAAMAGVEPQVLLWPVPPPLQPKAPPALPKLPACVWEAAKPEEVKDSKSSKPSAAAEAPAASASPLAKPAADPATQEGSGGKSRGPPALEEDTIEGELTLEGEETLERQWTPVEEQEKRKDRRTFFHTDGRQLTYDRNSRFPRHNPEEVCDVGVTVELKVEEVHFANPRIRVMQGLPAPMPTMLKWKQEQFDKHELECSQISFGDHYRVWCAAGIPSNRLLYAMKRSGVLTCKAVVVAPPPPPADGEEDVDMTYGASVQGIQLVP